MEVLNFLSLFFFLGVYGEFFFGFICFIFWFSGVWIPGYGIARGTHHPDTQSLANYLKGKNPLTIRSLWKVEGDLTAEEEAKALAMGVAKLGH